ncbi:MAG: HD domain-containing protein [Schaedlerella sp.]|nr:HD domain-containing protein [Schaedlerella sp.]
MTITEITNKMIDFYNGNFQDISHLLKVHMYAKTIGEKEGLNYTMQMLVEVAALLHDIACPLCREKYGSAKPIYQEMEGEILARNFLKDSDFPDWFIERVVYLVGHHHTVSEIDGMDYQILIEADYLVNTLENNYPVEEVKEFVETVFKTKMGKHLLKKNYIDKM